MTNQRSDGRRLRADRSRERIVHAMIALTRAGDMGPSAARVAETAGVGLRTVFNHFKEMDTLYREMSAIVEAEVKPVLQQPLQGRTWRARLQDLLRQRVEVYERIMPLRVAGELRRFASPFLMDAYRRFLRYERDALLAVLPQRIRGNRTLLAALELTLGFQAWRRLRQDQRLSVVEAQAALMFAVARLLPNR